MLFVLVGLLLLPQTQNKQAVVNTTAGTFVIDLRPDLAPNHVAYFTKLAGEGAYDGTVFHRIITRGIVQGGDPISKDPAKAKSYGTGGLGILKAEISSEPATRGAVAAVIQPGKPDSAGAQFFVCVTDQPGLTGKYTIFGRVVDGMAAVEAIEKAPVNGRDARQSYCSHARAAVEIGVRSCFFARSSALEDGRRVCRAQNKI